MQSETGFPSSHQLKSYVASKSRLKLAARCPVSGCWPSCSWLPSQTSPLVHICLSGNGTWVTQYMRASTTTLPSQDLHGAFAVSNMQYNTRVYHNETHCKQWWLHTMHGCTCVGNTAHTQIKLIENSDDVYTTRVCTTSLCTQCEWPFTVNVMKTTSFWTHQQVAFCIYLFETLVIFITRMITCQIVHPCWVWRYLQRFCRACCSQWPRIDSSLGPGVSAY